MEVLKLFSKICHCLQPTVERMRREVFGIIPSETFKPMELPK